MAEFKDRLKELRTAKGISQQELADHFNVHAMTISGYERGIRRPSFDMLDALAEFFDVNLDYLLGMSSLRHSYPRHGEGSNYHHLTDDDFAVMEQIGDDGLPIRSRAYADRIMQAYEDASPDTQAAVRAILHVEEDPDGDR